MRQFTPTCMATSRPEQQQLQLWRWILLDWAELLQPEPVVMAERLPLLLAVAGTQQKSAVFQLVVKLVHAAESELCG